MLNRYMSLTYDETAMIRDLVEAHKRGLMGQEAKTIDKPELSPQDRNKLSYIAKSMKVCEGLLQKLLGP